MHAPRRIGFNRDRGPVAYWPNFLRHGRRVLLTGRVHIIAQPVYIGALMGKLITGTPGAVLGAFGSRNTVTEFR
jgi:hypothetical protein